jgi:hypothetical protein
VELLRSHAGLPKSGRHHQGDCRQLLKMQGRTPSFLSGRRPEAMMTASCESLQISTEYR